MWHIIGVPATIHREVAKLQREVSKNSLYIRMNVATLPHMWGSSHTGLPFIGTVSVILHCLWMTIQWSVNDNELSICHPQDTHTHFYKQCEYDPMYNKEKSLICTGEQFHERFLPMKRHMLIFYLIFKEILKQKNLPTFNSFPTVPLDHKYISLPC